MSLSHGSVGWSTLCACGVSYSYSFTYSCDSLSSILKIPTESTIRMALLYASVINVHPATLIGPQNRAYMQCDCQELSAYCKQIKNIKIGRLFYFMND